tara:strand:- start:38 stop:205 length:168 start_codon:yes stop_codon:yes gene_type:complete
MKTIPEIKKDVAKECAEEHFEVIFEAEQLVCGNCDNTLCEEELSEGICFNCDTQV